MAPEPSQNIEPGMLSPQERDTLVGLLEKSRDALLKVTFGLSDRRAATRPAADVWAIVDCVEHLAVSDEAILSLVTDQILSGPADPNCVLTTQGKAEFVMNVMRDRSEKRKTFPYLEPVGRWNSLSEAVAAFQHSRERSIEYVRT